MDISVCASFLYVSSDSRVSAANTTNVGLDTLEEEEEKTRFFSELEAEASSTLDYSKLNRELECTSSTNGTSLRYVNSHTPKQRT